MKMFRSRALRRGSATLAAFTAGTTLAVPLYAPASASAEASAPANIIILGRDRGRPCNLNGVSHASGTVVEMQVKDTDGHVIRTYRIRCEDGQWMQL